MFENCYRRRVGSDYAGHLSVVVRPATEFNGNYTQLVGDDGHTVAAFKIEDLAALHEAIGEALWLQRQTEPLAAARGYR